jgi:GntR family transcriptional repressor for pyruvate dehydrogenase complex
MPAENDFAERLLEVLAERGLASGDRLPPERSLASELGVSRSHLREGLRRLIDLGVVRSQQGSGNYLVPVELDDLIEARLRIEPYAARLAAARRSERDLELLAETVDRLRATVADPTAFAQADELLHRQVTAASGSLALRVLLDALGDLLRYSRARTAVESSLRETALPQLEALVDAIGRGDGDASEAAMRAHLRSVAAVAAARA